MTFTQESAKDADCDNNKRKYDYNDQLALKVIERHQEFFLQWAVAQVWCSHLWNLAMAGVHYSPRLVEIEDILHMSLFAPAAISWLRITTALVLGVMASTTMNRACLVAAAA